MIHVSRACALRAWLQGSHPLTGWALVVFLALPPQNVAAQTPTVTAQEALRNWREANQQVGTFPRGHIDLLRWEAQNPVDSQPPPAPSRQPLLADEAMRTALSLHPELLQPPGASAIESNRLHQALQNQRHAVHRAWLDAVAAREALTHQQALLHNADSGAELGRRMVAAGNWSQARLLREQLIQARQQAALQQAQAHAMVTAETLLGQMGLWQPDDRKAALARLPSTLPALPAPPAAPPDLTAAILNGRPELLALRPSAERAQAAVPARQRAAWAAAWAQAVQASTPPQTPMTDATTGHALILSDAVLQRDHAVEAAAQALARWQRQTSQLLAQARQAWASVTHAHTQALHAQAVVLPLQTALEQETLLRYNGMLQSTWDLLAASRVRQQAEADAADARHRFWQALLGWQTLLAGGDAATLSNTPAANGGPPSADGGH